MIVEIKHNENLLVTEPVEVKKGLLQQLFV